MKTTRTEKMLRSLPFLLVVLTYQFASAAIGLVTDSVGNPIAGQIIEFYYAESETDSLVTTLTSDSNGNYPLTSLGYGTYYIHFKAGTFPSQWQGLNGTTTHPEFKILIDPAYSDINTILRTNPFNNSPQSELKVTVVDSALVPIESGFIGLIRQIDTMEVRFLDLATSVPLQISDLHPGTYTLRLYETSPYPIQYYSNQKNTSFPDFTISLGIKDTLQITMTADVLPEGNGKITGTVSDSLGNAIPGAYIQLYPIMYPVYLAYSTTAATDGSFELFGLADQGYHLKISTSDEAYPDQWFSDYRISNTLIPESPVYVSSSDSTHYEITLVNQPYDNTPKGEIRLQLIDKNGDTIQQQAEVWASDHNGSYKATFNPDLNEYRIDSLKHGSYTVKVQLSGHPVYYYGPDSALTEPIHHIYLLENEITSRQLVFKSVISLKEAAYVRGTVSDTFSNTLAGVRVQILDTSFNVLNELYTDSYGNFGPLPIKASAPHLVSFEMFPYPLQYWSPQKNTSTATSMNYVQGALNTEINVSSQLLMQPPTDEELANQKIIKGFVTDLTTHDPLSGVEVLLLPSYMKDSLLHFNPWQLYEPFSAITDASGYYAIEATSETNYILLAREKTYVSQFYSLSDLPRNATVIDFSQTSKVRADFQLRPGGSITGTVKNSNGSPVQDAMIELKEINGEMWFETKSDELGNFRFVGLPGKQFILTAFHNEHFPISNEMQEHIVIENSTIQAKDIILDRGSIISGTVSPSDPIMEDILLKEYSIGTLELLNVTADFDTEFLSTAASIGMNHYYSTQSSSMTFITMPAPSGSYKLLFSPHSRGIANASTPFSPSLGWSFAQTTDWSKTPVYTVTPPDSLKGIDIEVRKGYEVYGTIRMSDSKPVQEYGITAYVKKDSVYVPVARSHLNTEHFELPGLIDGEDYYMRVSMKGYHDQFWSNSGTTAFPDVPYHFSTTEFIPLDIVVNSEFNSDIPEPSPIKPVSVRQTGLKRIELFWEAPPDASPSEYKIYRFPGNPDFYKVTKVSEWKPAIPTDSLMKMSEVMFSSATSFVDTNIVPGKPYIYAVTWQDEFGRESGISVPYPPELSSYIVNEFPARFNARANVWYMLGVWGGATQQIDDNPNSCFFMWDDKRTPDKLMSHYITPSDVMPTKGYWFKSVTDTLISIPSSATENLLSKEDSLKLVLNRGKTGWNQISSPYPYPISPVWMSSHTVWEWLPDSGGYRKTSRLEPWKAYWVNTEKDTSLGFYPLLKDLQALNKKSSNTEWEVKVSLSGKGVYDPDNYIGTVKSLAKKTGLQELEPPGAFDFPQLFFIDGKSTETKDMKLSKLYKGASTNKQEWMVGISPSTKELVITFEGLSAVPEELNLYWIDQKGAADIRSVSEISIPAHSEETYGYILATSETLETDLFSGELQLKKTSFNPYRKTTAIEFVLPYKWSSSSGDDLVSIDIYDLKGRNIRSLLNEPMLPGRYRVVWDGLDSRRNNVPEGIYLMRIKYRNARKSLKLIRAY